ncbi:MAG: fibronectin/fibrinogen-binding protein [Firmicutes bacterium]|nr:fibronectin/fibrinogen-binding protein [Bacillota bacterium]
MAYNGLTMAAVRRELEEVLIGARVEKISQPHDFTIVFNFRTQKSIYRLLCSAHTQYARVHLTKANYANPLTAPPFCMLLRKHLQGARLQSIRQDGLERILTFVFRAYDEFGTVTEKYLLCEIMGKHSNLILTRPLNEEMIILGSIKKVDAGMSRYRVVLPGEIYVAPPAQNKLDLFTLNEDNLAAALAQHAEKKPELALVNAVAGISKDLASQLIQEVSGQEIVHPLEILRPLTIKLRELAERSNSGRLNPCILKHPAQKPRFFLHQDHSGSLQCFSTVNEALDAYFTLLERKQRENQLLQQLRQIVQTSLNRLQKRLQLQQKELQEMENADQYKLWGELLTASLYLLRPGMTSAQVPNYYDEEVKMTEIPLNPALSPQANAQLYFKKYRKLHDGKKFLLKRLQNTQTEIHYLDTLLFTIEQADAGELEEIREEMELSGLIRKQKSRRKKEKPSQPLHFLSPDGIDIYVGKNNRQNEQLTLKNAHSSHYWLHVKDLPGSHVIIKNSDPPETTLLYAAKLAATFSKARNSANVAVDYTQVKHVKKPKGAKPGMVIYDHHKTLFVTPFDPEKLQQLSLQ